MYKLRFRSFRFSLIVLAALIVQASFPDRLSLMGVKPDLILLLVIFYAVHQGSRAGIICGMLLGLAVDSLSAGIVGVNVFCYGMVGLLSGMFKDRVYAGNLFAKIILAVTGTLLAMTMYYLIAGQIHRLPSPGRAVSIVLIAALYTTIVNLLLFDFIERKVVARITTI